MVTAVINILGIVYFARVIESADLGIYFLFLALLGLTSIFADFGINTALTKRISEQGERGSYFGAAILLQFLALGIVSLALLLFQGIINSFVEREITRYLIFSIWLQQYAKLLIHTLHGELRVGETASIEVAQRTSWLLVGVVLIEFNYGLFALIYGLLVGFGIKLLLAGYRIETGIDKPDLGHLKSIFSFSRFSFISTIGGYTYSWMDILIIGYFLTSSHVAAYEVAWRITGFILIFSRSLGTAVFPQVSQWSANDAREKIAEILPRATFAAVFISIPAFFGTFSLSTEILFVVFGDEYTIAATALSILMFEKILQSVHKIWGYSLQASGRPDQAAVATVVSIAVNITLNILLIPGYGLTGAAMATTISFMINTILHVYYLSNIVKITIKYRRIMWCVFSSIVMFVAIISIKSITPIDSIASLAGAVLLGAILYFAVVLLYKPIQIDTRLLVQKLTS